MRPEAGRQEEKHAQDAFRAAIVSVTAFAVPSAHADMVGAAAGAGTGLLVAGPPGAVVGGVIGAV